MLAQNPEKSFEPFTRMHDVLERMKQTGENGTVFPSADVDVVLARVGEVVQGSNDVCTRALYELARQNVQQQRAYSREVCIGLSADVVEALLQLSGVYIPTAVE